MQTRTPRLLAAAAALALFAGACTDVPTTPARAGADATPALSTSAGQPALVPNSVKYRDQGGKPATGRAGSAELQALALLSKDGTTTLTVQARHVDPAVHDTGEVSKLQLKAFKADGTVKFVRNLQGDESTGPMVLRGLMRDDRVQFQANVRGLDGNRTDVVTVTETVKRRPNLSIHLHEPSAATVGIPTVIAANVTERNGDMGTRADCELQVDGQPVDESLGIWVDAGDAVSCLFTHTFTGPGNHALVVRVRTLTSGGDWDVQDNADSGTIEIHSAGGGTLEFITAGAVDRFLAFNSYRVTLRRRDLQSGVETEEVDELSSIWDSQTTIMNGNIDRRIPGPVQIIASQETGGRTVTSHTYSFPDLDRTGCMEWSEGMDVFHICSWDENSGFYWLHGSEHIVYHSAVYTRTWDEAAGTETYVYHRVEDYANLHGALPPMGDTYTWRVLVNGPDGQYRAELTLPVHADIFEFSFPPTCFTSEDSDFMEEWCGRGVLIDNTWWASSDYGH
jgi:hypothetical protein